jgi:exonuclease SbcD
MISGYFQSTYNYLGAASLMYEDLENQVSMLVDKYKTNSLEKDLIGKIVNEFSMIEDQEFILEQLIKVMEEEKPDALVIAGDLYDRSIPPVEAVELLDGVFSRILLELKIPILAIAGNHDSAERLSFGSKILTKNGLHIAGVFDKEITSMKFNTLVRSPPSVFT